MATKLVNQVLLKQKQQRQITMKMWTNIASLSWTVTSTLDAANFATLPLMTFMLHLATFSFFDMKCPSQKKNFAQFFGRPFREVP